MDRDYYTFSCYRCYDLHEMFAAEEDRFLMKPCPDCQSNKGE
jgi:hypothetical protein